MPIAIKSTGGGSVSLTAPSTASDLTLTLPSSTGTVALTASPTFTGTTTATTITSPAATALTVQSAGTTAMTIDTSQNVGMFGTGGSSTNNLSFTYNGASGVATIGPNSNGGSTTLTFGTSNSGTYAERARIDSSGNMLIGAASRFSGFTATNRLYVDQSVNDYIAHFRNTNGTAGNNYGVAITYSTAPNTNTNNFLDLRDSSAQRFAVYSNGGIANYQANNSNLSDRREKTNFAPAGDYLAKICAIPVQTFNYIDQNLEDDPGLTLGVVAQDVQAVAPELVAESNWGSEDEPKMRLSIYQTDLQYALMKCIQELKTELDAAKAEIAALKGA